MLKFLKNLFFKPLPQEAAAPSISREDAPLIFARAFSSDDGQRALSYLRGIVNTRIAGPDGSEGALRYYDGQRGLLQTITTLIEQSK